MRVWKILTGTIRAKLLVAVSIILVAGIVAVLYISTSLQVKQSRESMLKSATTVAEGATYQVKTEIQQSSNRARSWVVQSLKGASIGDLVEGDNTIVGVRVVDVLTGELSTSGFQKSVENSESILVSPETISTVNLKKSESYKSFVHGKVAMHEFAMPLVVENEKVQKILVLYFNPDVFKALFKTDGVYDRFLFNSKGEIILASESATAATLVQKKKVPEKLREAAVKSPMTNGQVTLKNSANETYIGSFYKTGVSDLSVAVWTSEERILDTPRKIALQSTYLGAAILCLAMVFIIFFADSLVKPLLSLVQVTRRIAEGDFSVRSVPTTKDEIAILSQSFNDMAAGLAERERIKNIFGKFHSKAIFKKLLDEDKLRLGGEKLAVTVFFSDIRSFTSSAERMEPERVVDMLNEYMTEMVTVIEKYDGVVDKYVGDAIMAVWGLPSADVKTDAEKALQACLEMRQKLVELNERRRARNEPPIEIGMGLNSGEVIAGNIGSVSRMEYTVIGDTVNTASRMESLTKEVKTDLLLSESTAKLLDPTVYNFVGPMEASVKGKAEKVKIYGCNGFKAQSNHPAPPMKKIA